MKRAIGIVVTAAVASVTAGPLGCAKDAKDESGAAPASASASAAATSAAPSASAPGSVSATPPAPPPPPRADCPKGSSGPGTFEKPCEAKGAARQMEAAWTNKTDDKGPQFRVTNKSPLVILYGRIVVYFYDKAGKQLDVKDSSGKARPNLSCGGNIFGGVMKPGEKALLTFSCVKKESVPEGASAIEAEIATVGYADATEKKSDFYWKNDDLVPDARKKGGVK